MGSAQIGGAESKICANAEQRLDGNEFAGDARLANAVIFECSERFNPRNDRRNERLPCAGWQLGLDLGVHVSARVKQTDAVAATSNKGGVLLIRKIGICRNCRGTGPFEAFREMEALCEKKEISCGMSERLKCSACYGYHPIERQSIMKSFKGKY